MLEVLFLIFNFQLALWNYIVWHRDNSLLIPFSHLFYLLFILIFLNFLSFFLFFCRHCFHRNRGILVEGPRHHISQLRTPLYPQIPSQEIQSSQLLQVERIMERERVGSNNRRSLCCYCKISLSTVRLVIEKTVIGCYFECSALNE